MSDDEGKIRRYEAEATSNEEIWEQFLVLQLANSPENVCAERLRKPDYRETLSCRGSPFIKHSGYRQENRSPRCTKASCLCIAFDREQPIARDKRYYRCVQQQLAQLSHKTSIGRGERAIEEL